MRIAKARVHFIGVGGIGMCGLAELLTKLGAVVTGSDLAENANIQRLRALNIPIHIGHRPENLGEAEVVVYSSAIQATNPEIVLARKNKIPLIPRAEALAEIMRLQRGIAVGGTHGKTTTTSMVASIFLSAKKEPTIVVGGRLELIQSTALLGSGEWLIAEADESDGSFSRLSPEMVIVTNIDNDHLDYYGNERELHQAFYDFAESVPFYGVAVVCGDDAIVREVFREFPKRLLTYGFGANNDLVISGKNRRYELTLHGKRLGEIELQLPGQHNARNAAAAVCVALEAGIPFAAIVDGLRQFQGVDRRFQLKGEWQGKPVYDDYGHHPTEVSAVLEAFREKYPDKKLLVVFQPHRFSRTLSCWQQFLGCFSLADEVLMLDIYPAGERPLDNVTSEKLVAEIQHPNIRYLAKSAETTAAIRAALAKNDVLVTLGAGDVYKLGMEILGK